MHTEHEIHQIFFPLDACVRPARNRGSILVVLIVAMVLIGALGAAVVSLNSTGMFNIVSHNSNQNAYYLAEAGLRYAATLYKNTDNAPGGSVDDKNADDEKRDVLENQLDGCTYQMPDGTGQFSLDVKTFWLYAKSDFSSGSRATLYFPAEIPDNFDFPASGTLVRFDRNNDECTPFDFSGAVLDRSGLRVTCRVRSRVYSDDMLYLAFPVQTSQTVEPGGDITLALNNQLQSGTYCIPPKNGYFRILQGTTIGDFDDRLLFYERAVIDGTTLTLKDVFDRDNTQFEGITIGPGSESKIVFKKNLVLESTGSIGSDSFGASRTVKYAVPVTDSFKGEVPESITFKTKKDLSDNFSAVNGEGMEVASYITAGGNSLFATMTSIPTSTDDTKMGTFALRKEDTIENAWRQNGYQLDYDVQVKLSNGKDLKYGGEGLSVRMRPSNGDYDCLGVSMMKFGGYGTSSYIILNDDLPNRLKAGNEVGWIREWSWVSATVVDVLPDERKILVLYDDSADNFVTSGNTLYWGRNWNKSATVQEAYLHDMIPDGIKPHIPGKDLTDTLLLVLWHQEVQDDGSLQRRWLAYKELPESYDPYIQGNQYGHGTPYDGQIVHDNTSLVVRMREGYEKTTKVNKINVFYGDMYDTSDPSIPDHEDPNSIAYDIVPRKRYVYGEPVISGTWNPQWPPRKISQWSSYTDYFTHVQNGTSEDSPDKFQWDGLNNSTDIDFDVFELADDGTITISELVTPNSGTYKVPEIGLHAFGNVYKGGSGNFRVASFNDFALLLFTPGYDRGGFLSAVAY
ncbi:hypothetical protein [Desulfoplanes formicivorans]|uniref:Uncharacterized protein n=1 Tax=Desulfoplanes formicivorans TaxID=1592317 RepID=A0A194AIA2_9BACT|nr:hypothetical protein [Desulfoplanes formicivorans]GAU08960.1 hypothetical protein DPF_1679 [Desulfoplanes formicivorans]